MSRVFFGLVLAVSFYSVPLLEANLQPVTWACLTKATNAFQVPLALTLTVLATEGGVVGSVSPNHRGDYDIGPMQINSHWLPILKRLGFREEDLRDNGCANVAVGVWILRLNFLESQNLYKTLARYHSPNPQRGAAYVRAALKRAQTFNLQKTLQKANRNLSKEKPKERRTGLSPKTLSPKG